MKPDYKELGAERVVVSPRRYGDYQPCRVYRVGMAGVATAGGLRIALGVLLAQRFCCLPS